VPDGNYEIKDGSTFTTKKGVVETYTPADATANGADTAGAQAKNPADLKQKIEAMHRQHQKNVGELAAIKKQFSAMQADNKALRQSLSKISRVLEILVENTPEEPIRNRQFARNSATLSKADRIAALLKS
jgi:regulator of replication initiation timing